MELPLGQGKRHVPEEKAVEWDPIRRALQENEDWYRDLVEHSRDLLCIHDLEGRLLSINPALARVLGYTVEELLQIPLREIIAPEFRTQFDAYLRQIEQTGESRGLMAVVTRSGQERIWEYHNTLRTEGVASPIVRGIAHDVTERVRAEKALRTTNEQLLKTARERERMLRELTLFRTLLDQSTDAIEVVDPETMRFLDVNERACVELGYSREELLAMTVFDIAPDLNEQSRAAVQQRLREPGFAIEESVHRRKDGTTFLVEVNMRTVQLDREYVVAVSRDITVRRQAEEALRESERRQRLALQIGKIGAFEIDMESGRGTWTEELAEIVGVPSGFAGDFYAFCWEHVHPGDLARVKEEFAQLAQSREEREMEFRMIRPDGVMRWIRWRGLVNQDTASASSRVAGVIMDITERKRVEEAIATLVQVRADSSEHFFSSMACQLARCLEADYTIIGELIEGEEDKVRTIAVCKQGVIADNFTYDLAHTPCEGVMGQGACSYAAGMSEIFPNDLLLKQMNVKGYAGTPLRDSQGRTVGLMAALYTRPLANAKFVEAILQLFSTRTAAEIERKRTEEALRESEERFRVALKNSPTAVFNLDRDLRYTWIYNSQVPRPVSERLGKTLDELFDPEETARIMEIRRRVLETGVGVRHEAQVTYGGRKHYFDATIEPVLDSAGAVIGITGASMDVTELREASEALREAKEKAYGREALS